MLEAEASVESALASARSARERLAEAARRIRDNPDADEATYQMSEELSRIIAPLYAMEVREPATVLHYLEDAMQRLEGLGWRLSSRDPVGVLPDVMDAMTRLHPNERAVQRATMPPPEPELPPEPEPEPEPRPEPEPEPQLESEPQPPPEPEPEPEPEPPPSRDVAGWSVAPPSRERRDTGRAEIRTDIGYHSPTNFYTGFTGDLSDGGLFIATYKLLPVGTELKVSFVLPSGHQVMAMATVRWVREATDPGVVLQSGMGVEFEDLDEPDSAEIGRFLARREPIFHA